MEFLRRYARDRVGVFFGVLLLLLYAIALTAQWITPGDPLAVNLRDGFAPPSWKNLFGTDQFGRL